MSIYLNKESSYNNQWKGKQSLKIEQSSLVLTIYIDSQGQAINSCCDQYKCTFVAVGNPINCITIRRRALCTVYILITKGQVSGSEAQSMNIVVLAMQLIVIHSQSHCGWFSVHWLWELNAQEVHKYYFNRRIK